MREVRVVAGAEGCREAVEAEGVAVMVDALRASATITALFAAGAVRVLVATEVEQARSLKAKRGELLLIGERDCVPPPGFDAGNSPEEILELSPGGREVAFTSTTGAARLNELRGAAAVLVGSPVNLGPLVEVAARTRPGRPVFVVAAGLTGRPGSVAEDWLGAALIAQELARRGLCWTNRDEHRGVHWPDALDAGSIRQGFLDAPHGRTLIEKGLERDVRACSRLSWLDAVAGVVAYRERTDGPVVAELAPA